MNQNKWDDCQHKLLRFFCLIKSLFASSKCWHSYKPHLLMTSKEYYSCLQFKQFARFSSQINFLHATIEILWGPFFGRWFRLLFCIFLYSRWGSRKMEAWNHRNDVRSIHQLIQSLPPTDDCLLINIYLRTKYQTV